MNTKTERHTEEITPLASLLRRMGLVGFSFFLIKGLLWLLIPILAHLALFN